MEYPRPIPATDPPPAGVHVLALTPVLGWWQAQYFPDDANASYQADAWQFVGIEEWREHGEVQGWMPLPPVRES